MVDDPPLDRFRWPAPVDVALAVGLAAISLLVAVQAQGQGQPGAEAPTTWWAWTLTVIPSAAVAFRRTAPVGATVVAVAGQMLIWGLDLTEVFVAPLVLMYSASALGGRRGLRVAVAAGVAMTAMTAIGLANAPDVGADLVALMALSSAVAVTLGINAANQQGESARLAADLAVAELEQESAQEWAVARERERIARELHDLVGHSLAVIAVQAEAAQRLGLDSPEAAGEIVGTIGSTARESLTEVRRVLHAGFGATDSGADHDHQLDAEARLRPSSTLADLPELVERVAASGVAVELRLAGPVAPTEVNAATGAGVYRIVQEALTNVIKHAGPRSRARVRVVVGPDKVQLEVVDDGRGPALDDAGDHPTGMGLAGMTERARFLGGTLTTGANPGGGFRVRATIPLHTSPTSPGSLQ
ncbi:MAG: sensor histidine kinase [Acidimicrobiales bacterium]